MTNDAALEMIGISKRFGTSVALDAANIFVRPGTIHGLLGENGAGKTTLMRVAYGMVQPDRGSIRINGSDARTGNPSDAIARGIGMVHQHPENVPAMSVFENMELGGRGRLIPTVARQSASALAARVGFAIDVDSPAASLSIADQQRLEILKAVRRDARVLILDEPTAILAPTEARELLSWLKVFASQGGTVIVITHKLEEALGFADDLTVLRRGKTVLQRPAKGMQARALAHAMIGADESSLRVEGNRPVAESAVVVRAEGVTLRYDGGRVAIQDATFDVREGEIVGVVGVEGSGHHELLLALAGRRAIDDGSLRLPAPIGFVPEDRHRDAVALEFTLAENVAIQGAGTRRGTMAWREIERQTSLLIEQFDVRTRGSTDRMAALSGGNQQKMVLARELGAGPRLVVLENPTRGLDIRASAFVRDQIHRCRNSGVAVVMYSSDLDEVLEHADRILVVHGGTARWVASTLAAVGAAMLGVK